VDRFMPDGTCAPDAASALWHYSSVAAETLPPWSKRRAGKTGGARFKRIVPDPAKWHDQPLHTDPIAAAIEARRLEGAMYDWQLIFGYLSLLIPNKPDRWTCSEIAAHLAGIYQPERLDPCTLHMVAAWAAEQHEPHGDHDAA
jgi:hypothetical protein